MVWTPVPAESQQDFTPSRAITSRGTDGIWFPGSTSGSTIGDAHILMKYSSVIPQGKTGPLGWGRAACVTGVKDTHYNLTVERIVVECFNIDGYADNENDVNWGFRPYGLVDALFADLYVYNIGREHPFYLTPKQGKLTLRNCWGHRAGGQWVQLRLTGNRSDPDWDKPKEIEILGGGAVECGLKPYRAAFSLSVKTMGPNANVRVVNPFIQTVNQTNLVKGSDGLMKDSYGGACFEFCNSLEIIGGVIEMKNPKNGAVQFFDRAEADPEACAPRRIKWTRGKSCPGTVHLRDATKSCKIAPIDSPGEFVIQTRDSLGRWNKIAGRVPLTQGISW